MHNPHGSRQHSKLRGGVGNTTRTREMAVGTGAERGERGHTMAHKARGACGPEQSRKRVSDVKPQCPFPQHTRGCLLCVFRAVVRRDAARTVIYGRSIADEMVPPQCIHWVNVTGQ